MEKILLAIFSAHEYVYTRPGSTQRDWFSRPIVNRIEGIRNSWLQDVDIDYKIFRGQSREPNVTHDEIWLPCLDDYFHSCDKLKGVINYALDNSYTRIFKIDDDCFLWYDRLMANIPTADYVGSGRGWDIESSKRFPTIFAPGFSYWLSKKAMETFLRAPVGCWAEDRALGESLHRAGIHLTPDYRFHLCKPTKTNQYISDAELYKPNDWLSVHSLSPDQMRQYHKSLSTVITQKV